MSILVNTFFNSCQPAMINIYNALRQENQLQNPQETWSIFCACAQLGWTELARQTLPALDLNAAVLLLVRNITKNAGRMGRMAMPTLQQTPDIYYQNIDELIQTVIDPESVQRLCQALVQEPKDVQEQARRMFASVWAKGVAHKINSAIDENSDPLNPSTHKPNRRI